MLIRETGWGTGPPKAHDTALAELPSNPRPLGVEIGRENLSP